MAAKKTEVQAENKAVSYTKKRLLSLEKYQARRDLLSALLVDTKTYTQEEADDILDKFMKGKVK